ncbi:hypothetical protein SAMN06264364_10591 [Quadrisphaera granulorum]|uniref:Uncharacterized protein n=1 Tax=Quadrisphaera granulorum TaxID=317664 RepID=A0A316ADC5_9ACTN|nr:hypothetical protein BXY45_10591 [Quadrisphaera granulorum]SZE95830.1 hypothetical protein SAMN06264364_10591 [Quadrisphaera granulorum]
MGATPAPRGWDQLFRTPGLSGLLQLKLTDGQWLVGLWDRASPLNGLPGSYAAGFPHPQDLYLVDTCVIDGDGAVITDDSGHPKLTGVAVLVRWEQVVYAGFLQVSTEGEP